MDIAGLKKNLNHIVLSLSCKNLRAKKQLKYEKTQRNPLRLDITHQN